MVGGPGTFLFGDEERKELMDVIAGGHLSRFPIEGSDGFARKVETFERDFAAKIGVEHAVAVNSGASSLLCALAALGVGAGDEVIVPGFTYVASISSVVLRGATPVLAEIDDSLNINPLRIESVITPRTKAIMPVHILGNPCEMDAICEIAGKHGLPVLEDCCQAVGASYRGRRLGSWGDIAAYSFNPFKMLSSGEGGAVATKDRLLYERAYGFHDQGHLPLRRGEEPGWRTIIGTNMRINELTGAVLLAQLRKLDPILVRLRELKRQLKSNLKTALQGNPYAQFRRITDESGECATLLTLLFDTEDRAERFSRSVGAATLAHSAWHSYNNMEQFVNGGFGTFHRHVLPATDDLLCRAVNVSIGVVDRGLGAGFGLNINSTDHDVEVVAASILEAIRTL